MSELTEQEKIVNKWWLSRFDSKDYKTIRLYSSKKMIQEYTTANKKYSDEEDARCAFQVSAQCGLNVDHVEVDGKRFKLTNGYIVEVKNV